MGRALISWWLGIMLAWGTAHGGEERAWDVEKARERVAWVLKVESRGQPWNRISWWTDAALAEAHARRTGKPIFVYLYLNDCGPAPEPCCPGGRLLRAVALSDPALQKMVRDHFVPLKLGFSKLEGFPVDWPALGSWATAFKFSDGRSFTGCSVVSPDLEIQYASSGSAMMWELFESTGDEARKLRVMLREALGRREEERILRTAAGVTAEERRLELRRFREGVQRVVSSAGRFELPPKGFSIEAALELF